MSIGTIVASGTFTSTRGDRVEYEILRPEDLQPEQKPYEVCLAGHPEIIVPAKSLRNALWVISTLGRK